jgi:hypothetical protein
MISSDTDNTHSPYLASFYRPLLGHNIFPGCQDVHTEFICHRLKEAAAKKGQRICVYIPFGVKSKPALLFVLLGV